MYVIMTTSRGDIDNNSIPTYAISRNENSLEVISLTFNMSDSFRLIPTYAVSRNENLLVPEFDSLISV